MSTIPKFEDVKDFERWWCRIFVPVVEEVERKIETDEVVKLIMPE